MQPSSGFPPLGPHYPQARHNPWQGPTGGGSSAASEATWKRVAGELERSLHFLQRQHSETLAKLHEEVDLLKRENKELHYRLIMHPVLQQTTASPLFGKPRCQGSSVSKTPRGSREAAEDDPKEDGFWGLKEAEENATESKTSVEVDSPEGEKAEETLAEVAAPFAEPEETPAKEPPHRETELCDRTTSPFSPPSPSQSRAGDVKIPAASSNPFLANVLPSCMRKPPTLEECEAVIRQLWNINHMQMQELMYLRTCLEDIHKTKRIPEGYMLAGHIGNSQTTRFPRLKNAPKQCRMLTPLPAAERAVLPALKQTLGNAFAERQKRAQAVQRKRLHRTAL